MNAPEVLAAREAHNAVIADAVRLLDDPEIRAVMDRHAGFSFDAATVHSRLMATYVDFVKSDAAVAELIEAVREERNLRDLGAAVDAKTLADAMRRTSAALARCGGAK